MPKYTFRYFPAKALGEASRLLLAYGDVDSEDVRIEDEDWPAYKPKTPLGQMPVLEIDGKSYGQSVAIARFLGDKFHLSGSTLEESLEIDQNANLINDLRIRAELSLIEIDETTGQRKQKGFSTDSFSPLKSMLEKLDTLIFENRGHVALKKLTWADFLLTGLIDYIKWMIKCPEFDEKYPNIQRVIQNVVAIPQVKNYLDKAPYAEY